MNAIGRFCFTVELHYELFQGSNILWYAQTTGSQHKDTLFSINACDLPPLWLVNAHPTPLIGLLFLQPQLCMNSTSLAFDGPNLYALQINVGSLQLAAPLLCMCTSVITPFCELGMVVFKKGFSFSSSENLTTLTLCSYMALRCSRI